MYCPGITIIEDNLSLADYHGVPDDEVLLHPGDDVYPFYKPEIQIEKLAYKHVRCLWVFNCLEFRPPPPCLEYG